MGHVDALIAGFLGTDPIAGDAACFELAALGDAGEQALFARPRPFPTLRQHQRRWLRFVATREERILDRLLAILGGDGRNFGRYNAAFLLAGLAENQRARSGVYALLKTGFGTPSTGNLYSDYSHYGDLLYAWGYAGGSAATLWHFVRENSYAWEKLRTPAFRGACAAFARLEPEATWALERFVTTACDYKYVAVSSNIEDPIPQSAIDDSELWLQAYYTFTTWRRGSVADEVLLRWSSHDHWRVRAFGAQLLSALGLSRVVDPVTKWLRHEPIAAIRKSLLSALSASQTQEGADVILDYVEDFQSEAHDSAARALWRAGDKDRAASALLRLPHEPLYSFGESVVSLARLGHPHPQLAALLDSHDPYVRINAALAYAHLGDNSIRPRLRRMQRETATADEAVMLTAALAILGEPGSVSALHQSLVVGARNEYPHTMDLSRQKFHLQDAVLAGFAAGGQEGQPFLEAWRAEIEPLDQIAQPIIPSAITVREVGCLPGDDLARLNRARSWPGDDVAKHFARGYALIVGVANYPRVSRLPEIVLKDARDVAGVLRSPDFCGYVSNNVDLLLDSQATADAIRQGLRRLGELTGVDDTAIVFFSGHGGRIDAGPDAGAYLIPFDCDPNRLRDTAIGSEELTKLFSAIKAQRLVVLLDACHSAGVGELKAVVPVGNIKAGFDEQTFSLLAEGSGRVIMSSSRSNEVSLVLHGMHNSLFTHFLLEALKGACSTHVDGLVRVFDVFHYISDNVPLQASQHPIFKAHDVESNFPLSLLLGGKQAARLIPNASQAARVARSAAIGGKARIRLIQRLVTRWHDLVTYLEIPLSDQARFESGNEPRNILDWLDQRRRIDELRDAFNFLGWDDLIEELDAGTK